MKHRSRLWDQRGETLLEALASILIVALSSALLLTGIGAGTRLNRTAEKEAERRNAEGIRAERQEGEGTAAAVTVTFSEETKTAEVRIFGGDELASYRREGAR